MFIGDGELWNITLTKRFCVSCNSSNRDSYGFICRAISLNHVICSILICGNKRTAREDCSFCYQFLEEKVVNFMDEMLTEEIQPCITMNTIKYLNALFMITLASISCSSLWASSELISCDFLGMLFKAGPTAPIESRWIEGQHFADTSCTGVNCCQPEAKVFEVCRI